MTDVARQASSARLKKAKFEAIFRPVARSDVGRDVA